MAYSPEDQRALAASRRAVGGAAGSALPITPSGAAGSGVARATGGGAPARPRTSTPAPVRPRITSTASGQYTKPAPVPAATAGAVPDINAFLNSDTAYQDQLRQFAQALSDMQGDVTRRRGSLESNYNTSTKALADQRLKDLANIEADYGSRGLLRSGLYAKAQGDYETEYGNRSADLQRQQNDALNQLNQELNQYQSQQGLQSQAAREAAIRRRAEQYGI